MFGMIQQAVTCPDCSGSGEEIQNPCHTCHGEKIETTKVDKTIDIPAGIENGMQLKMTGAGNEGPR